MIRGLPHITGYRVECGCHCGCSEIVETPSRGGEYADERREFDAALVAAGWALAKDEPRWLCPRCREHEPASLDEVVVVRPIEHGRLIRQPDGRTDVALRDSVSGGFVLLCSDCGAFGPCEHGGGCS